MISRNVIKDNIAYWVLRIWVQLHNTQYAKHLLLTATITFPLPR